MVFVGVRQLVCCFIGSGALLLAFGCEKRPVPIYCADCPGVVEDAGADLDAADDAAPDSENDAGD